MLYFGRIAVSEGIDMNKTVVSKECDIFHYWYFLDKEFKFQLHVSNKCHYVLMMAVNLMQYLCNFAILNTHSPDGLCINSANIKSEVISLMHNIDLSEKMDYQKT